MKGGKGGNLAKSGQWNETGKSPNPKDKGGKKFNDRSSKRTATENDEKSLLVCFNKYVKEAAEIESAIKGGEEITEAINCDPCFKNV